MECCEEGLSLPIKYLVNKGVIFWKSFFSVSVYLVNLLKSRTDGGWFRANRIRIATMWERLMLCWLMKIAANYEIEMFALYCHLRQSAAENWNNESHTFENRLGSFAFSESPQYSSRTSIEWNHTKRRNKKQYFKRRCAWIWAQHELTQGKAAKKRSKEFAIFRAVGWTANFSKNQQVSSRGAHSKPPSTEHVVISRST